MDTLLQDLRHALRSIRTRPGFASVAILTLALGIGATTAIFSAVHGVLLRPLPYPDADRLAVVWLSNPEIERDVTSYPVFQAWQEAAAFEAMAGYTSTSGTFTGESEAEEVAGARVSAEFFPVLSTGPRLGSAIGETHTAAGGHQVVVLSHRLWSRRFGADPTVLGRTVVINGAPREVIGVMPQGFAYPDAAEFWLPIAPEDDGWQQLLESEGTLWLSVIGRLAPGATGQQASGQVAAITERFATEAGAGDAGFGAFTEPLRDTLVGDVRPALLVLLGAVALVLLIACANVANLLLARGAARQRELAVRTALGATGGRLTRHLLTESVLLAVLGGALGVAVAIGGTALLVSMGPEELPRLDDVRVDAVVVGFAALLSLLTGLLFGLAPALQGRMVAVAAALRDADRGASGRRASRARPLLVAGQLALALMLLVGAGLLLRSFAGLQRVDPGFRTEQVLSFRVTAGSDRYAEPVHVRQFYDRLIERLEALPGVEAATTVNTLFLARLPNMGGVTIEGRPPPQDGEPTISVTNDFVRPNLFRVLEMPLVAGRGFEEGDGVDGVPVAIVNESFARRLLPGEDPVGRRYTRGDPEDPDALWATIVGVVADSRRAGPIEPVRPASFRPTTQATPRTMEVLVRTSGRPLAAAPDVRRVVRELDPQMPVVELRSIEQALAEALATRRFVMLLLGAFAGLAVVLAAVGIYGVLSYLVGQRTRELGVRIALGAAPGAVLRLVLRQAGAQLLPGVALGTAGALALTRLLQSQLYGVSATDPLTFGAVITLLCAVGLLASYLPARRAARLDPVIALRAE